MALRVGAYERISDDKEEEARGVARQAADNEAQAKLRGWKMAEHYQDNDVSAFKENIVRPAFERLLADLEAGVLDGVVVYNQDRFVRQPSDLERAIRVYDRAKAAGRQLVFATVSGDLDLGSDDGITMARVMVAFANKASRDTARRVARKHLEFAQTGVPISAWRPFGWKEDRRALETKEAEAIRDGVRKLLAGVPLAEVCRSWNVAGTLTPRGNAWVSTAARQVFRNPRLGGWRLYKGEIVQDVEGQPVLGQWEPILTVPEWEALQAELDSPERKKGMVWQKGQKAGSTCYPAWPAVLRAPRRRCEETRRPIGPRRGSRRGRRTPTTADPAARSRSPAPPWTASWQRYSSAASHGWRRWSRRGSRGRARRNWPACSSR